MQSPSNAENTRSKKLEPAGVLVSATKILHTLKAVLQSPDATVLQRVSNIINALLESKNKENISVQQFAEIRMSVKLLISDALRIKFAIDNREAAKSQFLKAAFLLLGVLAKCVNLEEFEDATGYELSAESAYLFGRFHDLIKLSKTQHTAKHMSNIDETLNELMVLFAHEFINTADDHHKGCAGGKKELFKVFVNWHLDLYYLSILEDTTSNLSGLYMQNGSNWENYHGAICRALIIIEKTLSCKLSREIIRLIQKDSSSALPSSHGLVSISPQNFYLSYMHFCKDFKLLTSANQHLSLYPKELGVYNYNAMQGIRELLATISEEIGCITQYLMRSTSEESGVPHMSKLSTKFTILERNYSLLSKMEYTRSVKIGNSPFDLLEALIDIPKAEVDETIVSIPSEPNVLYNNVFKPRGIGGSFKTRVAKCIEILNGLREQYCNAEIENASREYVGIELDKDTAVIDLQKAISRKYGYGQDVDIIESFLGDMANKLTLEGSTLEELPGIINPLDIYKRQKGDIKEIYTEVVPIFISIGDNLGHLVPTLISKRHNSISLPNCRDYELAIEFNIMVFYALARKLLDKDIGTGANRINTTLKSEIKSILHDIDDSEETLVFDYKCLVDRISVVTEDILLILDPGGKNVSDSIERPYNVSIAQCGPLQNVTWLVPNFAILTGKSGVGKTHLIRHLEERYECQLVIDAKHLETLDKAFEEIKKSSVTSGYRGMATEQKSIEEICYHISKFGPFPQVVMGAQGEVYRFPIIELLEVEVAQARNTPQGTSIIVFPIKDRLNALLEKYKVGFSVGEVGDRDLYFVKGNKKDLVFSQLSSGEKTLFAVVSCAVCNALVFEKIGVTQSHLMLFDEVDIHFHPEYTKAFFEIIKDNFGQDTYTVMTTHNPATISLATENVEIWNMDTRNTDSTIMTQQNKRLAISSLSNGLLTVIEDVNYVLVENVDDAKFYSMVYAKFASTSLSGVHGSKLIFTPVGYKPIDTEVLKESCALVESLKQTLEGNAEALTTLERLEGRLKTIKGSNDHGGGCNAVKDRNEIHEYEIIIEEGGMGVIRDTPKQRQQPRVQNIIWGLIDGDKKNVSTGTIKSIDVYSFENYLCMPMNLFYLMKRNADFFDKEKKPWYEEQSNNVIKLLKDGTRKEDLQKLLQELTQFVLGTLLSKCQSFTSISKSTSKDVSCLEHGIKCEDNMDLKLVCGVTISCPKVFFEGIKGGGNGHKLHDAIGLVMFPYAKNQNMDIPGSKERMKIRIFGALEKIPAHLLPISVQRVIEDLMQNRCV